jgi:hypothetical protein
LERLALVLGALGVAIALVEIPADGKSFKLRAIRRDKFLRDRTIAMARKGALARNSSLSPEARREACRKAALVGAAKRRKRAQMSLLGAKGGNKTQAARRAAAEAENVVDNSPLA